MQTESGLPFILNLVEAQKTIDLAKGHLKDVRSRLNKAFDDQNRLASLLNEKFELVEKLENYSLRRLFSSILKNPAHQLEMERQEYLQVVLQYNEAKKNVSLLEYEAEILKKQIEEEENIKSKLEKAIAIHREDILLAYPQASDRIFKLEGRISEITANTKELAEALEVANELQYVLKIIIDNLERASNWGDWEDMKFSRKIETKAKNQFVDKALTQVYVAQNLFEKFEKELKDIHDHQEIRGSYHFHDFGSFTEVYYNRLIADWIIQQQIKNSKMNVEGVLDNVNLITATLTFEIKNSKTKIEDLNRQIEFVIKETLSNA